MSALHEIEAAIPKLSPCEIAELRAWLDDFAEQQLELNVEVKAELDTARRDIAGGRVRTRQPT